MSKEFLGIPQEFIGILWKFDRCPKNSSNGYPPKPPVNGRQVYAFLIWSTLFEVGVSKELIVAELVFFCCCNFITTYFVKYSHFGIKYKLINLYFDNQKLGQPYFKQGFPKNITTFIACIGPSQATLTDVQNYKKTPCI